MQVNIKCDFLRFFGEFLQGALCFCKKQGSGIKRRHRKTGAAADMCAGFSI